MALDERRNEAGASKPYARPEASGTTVTASQANPLHLALAELQGELVSPDLPTGSTDTPFQAPPNLGSASSPTAPASTTPIGPGQPLPPQDSQVPEKVSPARVRDVEARFSDQGANFGRPADLSPGGRQIRRGEPAWASRFPVFLGTLAALALTSAIFGLVGAWTYEQFLAPKLGTRASVLSPNDKPERKETSASPEDSKTALLGSEIDALKSKAVAFAERLDQIQKRFDEFPEPPAPPDLTPLQRQLDDLSKATRGIPGLSESLGSLDARIAALEKGQKSLRDEFAAASRSDSSIEPAKLAVSVTTPPSLEASPTPSDPSTTQPPLSETDRRDPSLPLVQPIDQLEDPMTNGADLFRQGRYQEALAVFSQLEKTDPDDARVWYFAALSRGFATRQWTGETLRLVQKGVACEKAGNPTSAEIDAVLRGLSGENVKSDNGRKWLEFYRQNAKTR